MVKMKFRITVLLIVISIITNCSSNRKELKTDKEMVLMDSINLSIDSAIVLYDLAIVDMKQGADHDSTVAKYKNRIQFLHSQIAIMMDTISYQFVIDGKTKREYEEFMENMQWKKIKGKANELEKYGVIFNLN
jgi:uncharacterized protein YcfL